LSIAQLASVIVPTHDVENVALWLSLTLRVQAPILGEIESFEIMGNDRRMQFTLPKVELLASHLADIEGDL
jgi:hypothetical protein